jgi:hypothetical protein
MSESKKNAINIEHIKGIIKRQTDYSDEELNLKMQIHNNDPMAILREYMGGTTSVKKEEPKKSVNQTIYSEIRHLMDHAASNYKQKKEMEERNNIMRENLIRKRDKASKKLREKLNVVQEEASEAEASACETEAAEAEEAAEAASTCETETEAASTCETETETEAAE